jgi:hypothetical protein
MKLFVLLAGLFVLTVSADKCGKKSSTGDKVYKGKLEIKALCMNYTIRLLDGNIDTSQIAANWTDENTGKSYKNVFALANPCSFPSSIDEGGEFNFIIDSTGKKGCAVCMAYYPTPPKKLHIKVLEK